MVGRYQPGPRFDPQRKRRRRAACSAGVRFPTAFAQHPTWLLDQPPSFDLSRSNGGPVAQWLEQSAHNALVGGSSPSGPTKPPEKSKTSKTRRRTFEACDILCLVATCLRVIPASDSKAHWKPAAGKLVKGAFSGALKTSACPDKKMVWSTRPNKTATIQRDFCDATTH